MINKNFPNYTKSEIPVRVISVHPAGDNHKQRRVIKAQERGRASSLKRFATMNSKYEAKERRILKEKAKVIRATTRREEREKRIHKEKSDRLLQRYTTI